MIVSLNSNGLYKLGHETGRSGARCTKRRGVACGFSSKLALYFGDEKSFVHATLHWQTNLEDEDRKPLSFQDHGCSGSPR
jgi:hypothetical protein